MMALSQVIVFPCSQSMLLDLFALLKTWLLTWPDPDCRTFHMSGGTAGRSPASSLLITFDAWRTESGC
jgi:hypothetical protein